MVSAVNTWLATKRDIPTNTGPDGPASPHAPIDAPWTAAQEAPFLAPLFQVAEPIQDSLEALTILNKILLSGSAPVSAVHDSLDRLPVGSITSREQHCGCCINRGPTVATW